MKDGVFAQDSRGGPGITIRRLNADGIPWRVRAEVWPEGGGYSGRLTFEPDVDPPPCGSRHGPASLRGPSQAEVLAEVHGLSERRLRALLHSLG